MNDNEIEIIKGEGFTFTKFEDEEEDLITSVDMDEFGSTITPKNKALTAMDGAYSVSTLMWFVEASKEMVEQDIEKVWKGRHKRYVDIRKEVESLLT